MGATKTSVLALRYRPDSPAQPPDILQVTCIGRLGGGVGPGPHPAVRLEKDSPGRRDCESKPEQTPQNALLLQFDQRVIDEILIDERQFEQGFADGVFRA